MKGFFVLFFYLFSYNLNAEDKHAYYMQIKPKKNAELLKTGVPVEFEFDFKEQLKPYKRICLFFKFKDDLVDPGEIIKYDFIADDKHNNAGQTWENNNRRSIAYRDFCFGNSHRIAAFFKDGKNKFTVEMEKGTAKLFAIDLQILLQK